MAQEESSKFLVVNSVGCGPCGLEGLLRRGIRRNYKVSSKYFQVIILQDKY